MQRLGTRALWSAGLMAALAGCVGNISDLDSNQVSATPTGAGGGSQHAGNGSVAGGGSFPVGGSGGSTGGGSQAGNGSVSATRTLPMRRLTPFELDNALRELVGDQSGAALELRPGQAKARTETDPTENKIGMPEMLSLEALVYSAAKGAAQSPDALLGCSPSSPGDDCVKGFVRSFGRRAFRRSLTDQDVAMFSQLEASLEGPFGRTEAVARMVQAILLSPEFLYLTSFGVDDAASADTGPDVLLEGHELASRLAFFLWASLPDEALLAAADQGALATPAQVAAQVDRMLGKDFEAKAANAAARFVAGWLGILDLRRVDKKDTNGVWNPSLVRSMLGETDALVKDWFVRGEDGIAALVEADYSFVDENLASFYGVGGVSGGDPVRVQITAAAKRRGVLAHASVLAAHSSNVSSSPVHRGQWLLDRVLCAPSPPAPNNANSMAPIKGADMSTREWNEAILGQCGGCHVRLAPPGFLFEDFDSIGRHRDTDNGKPVTTDATLKTGADEIDGQAHDHQDLAQRLGKSEILPQCAAEQWLSYALGTAAGLDDATRSQVTSALKTSARDTMRTIATADAFRFARRTVNP